MHLQCLSKNKRQNANIQRFSFAEKGIYQKIFVYIKRIAGCKIEAQCKSAVGADSILSLTIAAGKEARLARGGIRTWGVFESWKEGYPAKMAEKWPRFGVVGICDDIFIIARLYKALSCAAEMKKILKADLDMDLSTCQNSMFSFRTLPLVSTQLALLSKVQYVRILP